MNARQRRKLGKIKDAMQTWRGHFWFMDCWQQIIKKGQMPHLDRLSAFVKQHCQGRHIVQAALKQGKAHRVKRDAQIQDALYRRQALGSDRWLESILQNADFYAGYPPVVVKRVRDGREVLE